MMETGLLNPNFNSPDLLIVINMCVEEVRRDRECLVEALSLFGATLDPVVLGIVPKLIGLWTQKNNVTLFFHVCLNTFQKFPIFKTERILCILPKDAAGVIEPPTHSTSWDSVETFVGCSIDTFSRREEEKKTAFRPCCQKDFHLNFCWHFSFRTL